KEIQAKYKEDRQRQGEEVMKFYKEHGVNPFASCLPLLLQLPVFVSLFYMLRTDLKKHICGSQLVTYYNQHAHLVAKYSGATHIANVAHLPAKFIEQTSCQMVAHGSAKFLFIPDITEKGTGVVLVVLLVLYVGSQLGSTVMMPSSVDPNQRRIMMLLPLFFVIILYRYPAGLLLYWITTNLWTVGQSYFVRRRVSPPPTVASGQGATVAAGKGSPNGKTQGSGAAKGEPALAGAAPGSTPPPPPRKKKKRSGRRR
ncbi:MAG TPA: YidC/Oxa1 family membrane protein insertase, partial [Solirubrobacteraceae bacterium]